MNLSELQKLSRDGCRRNAFLGTEDFGVFAALDVEGRLFTIARNQVLHRINPAPFLKVGTREEYLNPGGDGLWPAPEGSRLGYEYSTDDWRVPPGLSGARYFVVGQTTEVLHIRAEIDLINSEGLGIPTAFEREIRITPAPNGGTMTVCERIIYLGKQELDAGQCRLAPWTLSQFDCGSGCGVTFPGRAQDIRDLYSDSSSFREQQGKLWRTRTDASEPRYQIALGENVPWIEFENPARGLRVRRWAEALPDNQRHIDIADLPPECELDGAPVSLSVYSDPSGFMEVEAAGGCPEILRPNDCLEVTVHSQFIFDD